MSAVNKPDHYLARVGDIEVECLDIIEYLGMNLNVGSAFQYIWRAGRKDRATKAEDLKKAVFYLNREIACLEDLNEIPF